MCCLYIIILNIYLHFLKVAVLNYYQPWFFSCKEYYNFNAFFAILMGLSDVAVSRLSTTWDKLPSKSRKQFTEYETLIDPSRNHRAYRITVGKLPSPMIPFMPLLIKGRSLLYCYKPINLFSAIMLYNNKH